MQVSTLKTVIYGHILDAVNEFKGNRRLAAKSLDITENCLRNWLRKMWDEGIPLPNYETQRDKNMRVYGQPVNALKRI